MITIFSLSFCIVPQDRKTRSAVLEAVQPLFSVAGQKTCQQTQDIWRRHFVDKCSSYLHCSLRPSCEQTQDVWIHALTLSISDEAHFANRLKTYGYMPSLSPFQTRRILRTDSRRMATCHHSLHFSLRPVPPVRSRSPVQHGGGRRKP